MKKEKRLVRASLMAALCFVMTWVIQIPAPQGYVNLGDCAVLLAGWFLGPWWGGAAAAVGSTLVDVLGPYAIYAPATVIIKFAMAALAALLCRRRHTMGGMVLGAVAGILVMVGGYFFYESVILGFGLGAVASIPFNMVQGLMGGIGAVCVGALMRRSGAMK